MLAELINKISYEEEADKNSKNLDQVLALPV